MSEESKKTLTPIDGIEIRETPAYQCYRRYMESFFKPEGLKEAIEECRNFYEGRQYRFDADPDMPKPVINICEEGVDKITAKLHEMPIAVEFVADRDDEDLTPLDQYYEFLLSTIKDEESKTICTQNSLIDGTGVLLTLFDSDTEGGSASFKGFIKRVVLNFEDTFWENPYCTEEQDQRYCGYVDRMEVALVRSMVEGKDEEEKKRKQSLIAPDEIMDGSWDTEADSQAVDSELVNVYWRFFRVGGEVFYEMCTKYCNVYECPKPLNPLIRNGQGKKLAEEFRKALEKGEPIEPEKRIPDYAIDFAKHPIFEQAVRETAEDRKLGKRRFTRYPISLYKPYPKPRRIYGRSWVSSVIPEQKTINLENLLPILIMQYHAMPKWRVKPGALRGQRIDNSPNQVIVDYTSLAEGQKGIERIPAGDTTSPQVYELARATAADVRASKGTAQLTAETLGTDSSGLLADKVQHQQDLPLQIPQKRLMAFTREVALTDVMYLRAYVKKEKYYVVRDEAELELEEQYRGMAEEAINSSLARSQPPQQGMMPPQRASLPQVKRVQIMEIGEEAFDADFDVAIITEQGVARSVLSESQHLQSLYQYILAGNADPSLIKALVSVDPALSKKVRQKFRNGMESYELSATQRLTAENERLKSVVEQLMAELEASKRNVNFLAEVNRADRQAFQEETKRQKAINEAIAAGQEAGQPTLSESQVKANNSKGVGGTHFAS